MSVPTHSSSCRSKAFPIICKGCGVTIFYFTCSCGSKVFFDSLGYPWTEHICQDLKDEMELVNGINEFKQKYNSSDFEIRDFIKQHSVRTGKIISKEKTDLLNRKLGRINIKTKYLEPPFDQKIKGIEGTVSIINKDINFANLFKIDSSNVFGKAFLGNFLNEKHSEVRIRSVNNENKFFEYKVYIPTALIVKESIRQNDNIIMRLSIFEAKTGIKIWVSNFITCIEN